MLKISADRISKLTADLERSVDLAKKIFAKAPDMIPTRLEAFVFLPKEQVSSKLVEVISTAPEEMQETVCGILEQTAVAFERTVADMESRIQARQQPSDMPRREGSRPFKQFKQRRGEWG
jgi:hypothetical protein